MEHSDSRLDVGLAAIRRDPANNKARIVWALLLDLEAWHEARELIEFSKAEIVKRLCIDSAHCNRNVAQNLLALLHGDGHRILTQLTLIGV